MLGLIIFDFDDTLIDTSDVFYKSRASFLDMMEGHNIKRNLAQMKFEQIDSDNILEYGYSPYRYYKSMLDTFKALIGKEPSKNKKERIRSFSHEITSGSYNMISGAIELLESVYGKYYLALVTRGRRRIQKTKILNCNIERYFEHIEVVSNNKGKEFQTIYKKFNVDKDKIWVVGDSIKGDINPGIELGANCILYLYQHPEYSWEQEYGEEAKGEFYLAENLQEVKKILDNSGNFQKIKKI